MKKRLSQISIGVVLFLAINSCAKREDYVLPSNPPSSSQQIANASSFMAFRILGYYGSTDGKFSISNPSYSYNLIDSTVTIDGNDGVNSFSFTASFKGGNSSLVNAQCNYNGQTLVNGYGTINITSSINKIESAVSGKLDLYITNSFSSTTSSIIYISGGSFFVKN